MTIASLLALTVAVGCGDDTDTTTGTTDPTGATGGSGGQGGDGSGGDGSGGDGGSGQGGQGGGGVSNCSDYCTQNIATCTGDNVQYLDQGQCEGFCALFPDGMAGDTTGDTFECRAYHLGAAMADADTHCHHSGPYGGGVCADSGDVCDAFCTMAMSICTDQNEAFSSLTECANTCSSLPDVSAGNYKFKAEATGDGLNCRGYHLQAAISDPDTHCTHVGRLDPNDDPCSP